MKPFTYDITQRSGEGIFAKRANQCLHLQYSVTQGAKNTGSKIWKSDVIYEHSLSQLK